MLNGQTGLVVPYKDILTEDFDHLKRALENFVEKIKSTFKQNMDAGHLLYIKV